MRPAADPFRTTRGTDSFSQTKLPLFKAGAVLFDGIDDYLEYQGSLGITNTITLIVAFSTQGGGGGANGRGGWILSNNDLYAGPPAGPVGFGLYMDELGAIRPLVGSENRYSSSTQMPQGTHVATLVVSASQYSLWVNSTLEFDKLDTSNAFNPQQTGPRSAASDPAAPGANLLQSNRPMTLGVGATAGQLDDYFLGSVAEVLLFGEVLSDADRADAERALCLRWQDCVASAGSIDFEVSSATVAESGGYYNVKVERTGGSDGLVQVGYTVRGVTAEAGSDFYRPTGMLTWEHGDATPKYVAVRLLDHFERRPSDLTLQVRLSAKCSTYASSLAVTAQTFTLTIAMRPDPFWTGASLVGFGFNGGESILVQAANLDPGATYACGFTRRIEDAACVCESDGTSCQSSRKVDCGLAEAGCMVPQPLTAATVDLVNNIVT